MKPENPSPGILGFLLSFYEFDDQEQDLPRSAIGQHPWGESGKAFTRKMLVKRKMNRHAERFWCVQVTSVGLNLIDGF